MIKSIDDIDENKANINLETFQLVDGILVYKCSKCNLNFSQNTQFYRHLSEKHSKLNRETAKYVCNDCDRLFTKKYLLDIHYQIHHLTKVASKCDICLVKFKSVNCLRQHMKRKLCNHDSKCPKCEKLCHNPEKLKKHLHNNHSYKCVGFRCNSCQKKYRYAHSYITHNKRMHLN